MLNLLLTGLFLATPAHSDSVELNKGVLLLLPDSNRDPSGPPGLDLVLHLHGAVNVVSQARDASAWNLPILVFNRKGLSSVYTSPFEDDRLLPELLDRVRTALHEQRPAWTFPDHPKLLVSSFSAGFGGVRELLKSDENTARIDALILADSLYCGYQNDDPSQGLDAEKMTGFRAFARDAAAGRKRLLVSHSAQKPDGYASTTETAADLISRTNTPRIERLDFPDPDFTPTSIHRKAGLLILGFPGAGPDDHMAHLRHLGSLWKSIENLGAP